MEYQNELTGKNRAMSVCLRNLSLTNMKWTQVLRKSGSVDVVLSTHIYALFYNKGNKYMTCLSQYH
jgi:hypothetical protein